MSNYEIFIAAQFYEKDKIKHLREISVLRSDKMRYHFLIKNPGNPFRCLNLDDRMLYSKKESQEHGLYWSDGDFSIYHVEEFLKKFLVNNTFIIYDDNTLHYLQNTLKIQGTYKVMDKLTPKKQKILYEKMDYQMYTCYAHDLYNHYNEIGHLTVACTMAMVEEMSILRNKKTFNLIKPLNNFEQTIKILIKQFICKFFNYIQKERQGNTLY